MFNLHWCYTLCTGVTLFALVFIHLKCTALSQSESSNFFMYIISDIIVRLNYELNTFGHKASTTLITFVIGKKKCHNSYNGDLKLLPRFLHPQEIWEQREHPSLDKFGQNKMRDVFSSNDQCFAGVIGEKFHF